MWTREGKRPCEPRSSRELRLNHVLVKLKTTPAVPTCDAGVGLPELLEFSEVNRFGGKGAFAVKPLDRSAYSKVVAREYIEPAEGEDQEHLRGPDTDTFHLGQFGDDLGIGERGDPFELHNAGGDLFREVVKIPGLLRRDSGGPQFFGGKSGQPVEQILFAANERDQLLVDGTRGAGGNLLGNDRPNERLEDVLIELQRARADAVDHLGENRIPLAQIFDGDGEVAGGLHLSFRISGHNGSKSESLRPIVRIFFGLPRLTASCSQVLASSRFPS